MPTSGTRTFSLNRDQVIKNALRKVGAIGSGETPDSNQVNDAAELLNVLMKSWNTRGMPLWEVLEVSIPLVAGTSVYTPTIRATKLLEANIIYSSTNTTMPMTILPRQLFKQLPGGASGVPVNIWADYAIDTTAFSVYPTPDTTAASGYILKVYYSAPIQDVNTASDTPDCPQEFIRALTYALAVELSYDYAVPKSERESLIGHAKTIENEAFDFNVEETSMFIQPDYVGR